MKSHGCGEDICNTSKVLGIGTIICQEFPRIICFKSTKLARDQRIGKAICQKGNSGGKYTCDDVCKKSNTCSISKRKAKAFCTNDKKYK